MSTSAPLPDDLRAAAEHYFGDRLDLAARYAELLATDGVVRGLIGPREVPRIWDRHLLNSVAMVELIGSDATVADVGSGAGLPGIPLAIAMPDLDVQLVEPQLRRTTFLAEVVEALKLDRVTVVRARAEEAPRRMPQVDAVVARAVAPLGRLAEWCLPLAKVGGRLLALKGASAAEEVAAQRAAVRRAGGGEPVVLTCGNVLGQPATVVSVVRERAVASRSAVGRGPKRTWAGRSDRQR